MLQGANSDLFNPVVPKAHNSECQNLLFSLQIKPVKFHLMLNWRILNFGTPGTNGFKQLGRASVCAVDEAAGVFRGHGTKIASQHHTGGVSVCECVTVCVYVCALCETVFVTVCVCVCVACDCVSVCCVSLCVCVFVCVTMNMQKLCNRWLGRQSSAFFLYAQTLLRAVLKTHEVGSNSLFTLLKERVRSETS